MQTITSRYRTNALTIAFLTATVAAFLTILPFSILRALAEPNVVVDATIVSVCLLLAAALMRKVVMHDLETSAWQLGNDTLIGGTRGEFRIELADIVALSPGVPVPPGARETPWHQSGLLLKLRDGRLLALNLLEAEGGRELMEALFARCGSALTVDLMLTRQELALLRRPRWNRLIAPA